MESEQKNRLNNVQNAYGGKVTTTASPEKRGDDSMDVW